MQRNVAEPVHPRVREAISGDLREASTAALLDAWRAERTSDLADTIEILDRATRPGAPATLRSVRGPRRLRRVVRDVAREPRRGAPPDPRVGRNLERTLSSPSDPWFRVDQVAHAVASFDAPSDEPSFADHLFALLEEHADAGTAKRLEQRARDVSIEADCNGAEMAARLRELAAALRRRYPADRTLSEAAATALRHRLAEEVASR